MQDEKSEKHAARIAIKPDIAYFRLIWDEVTEQFGDIDPEQRLRVFESIMSAMNALAISEGPYMGELQGEVEEYGWVKAGKGKRKKK